MLVLSRFEDEQVIIGTEEDIDNNIVITIVDVRGGKVRLGISAPPNIPIHRKEVWLAIQKEKAEEEKRQD